MVKTNKFNKARRCALSLALSATLLFYCGLPVGAEEVALNGNGSYLKEDSYELIIPATIDLANKEVSGDLIDLKVKAGTNIAPDSVLKVYISNNTNLAGSQLLLDRYNKIGVKQIDLEADVLPINLSFKYFDSNKEETIVPVSLFSPVATYSALATSDTSIGTLYLNFNKDDEGKLVKQTAKAGDYKGTIIFEAKIESNK